MPYLPLPPSQPPPIVQALPPEETPSTSLTTPVALEVGSRAPSRQRAQTSIPAPSTTVNSPASVALLVPPISAQISSNLANQEGSSQETLDINPPRQAGSTHFAKPGKVSHLSPGGDSATYTKVWSSVKIDAGTQEHGDMETQGKPQENASPSPPSPYQERRSFPPQSQYSEQVFPTQEVQNLQSISVSEIAASSASNLLKHYGFAQGELTTAELIDQWQQTYPGSSTPLSTLGKGMGERAVYNDPISRLDIKPPLPASFLKPISQKSSAPKGASENRETEKPLELYADRQEYDDVRRIFTAVGNVLLRFQEATLRANQIQVNLQTQLAVAEGNVTLTRGEQRLQGDRLEYNYVQNRGSFLNTRGEIYLPTASSDISTAPPEGSAPPAEEDGRRIEFPAGDDNQFLIEQIRENQPRQASIATEDIQRLRFAAERIEFDARGWRARNLRITHDPFSPPELEVRANEAQLVRVSPLEDRVEATRPRLVFDQGLTLPILRTKVILNRQPRDPAIIQIGYDDSDRGGFFVGRAFEPLLTDQSRVTLTPQFFLQRAVQEGNFNVLDPDLYGLSTRLNINLDSLTSLTGSAALTSLDLTEIGDNLRAYLRLRRPVGTPVGSHGLTLEYAYRDRVFNGSLGFQDIQNSLGAVLTSPSFSLGNTGIELNYRVGTRFLTAETDQVGLADPASLGRFQASASLRREFPLWQGRALPATATGGLRYTPEPVVPYLQLFTQITGTANVYTNGDTQQTLLGRVGIRGQLGHLSRPFLDYTGFSLSFSQTGLVGLSPFLFDRVADFSVLSAGVVQQVYGPIRIGVQAALSLNTGELFDTEYFVDYSRRTYGVTLRYSPSRQAGSINFRLSGFNWIGGTEPSSGLGVPSTEGGI